MSLKYALAYASYISTLVLAKPLGSSGPRALALQASIQSRGRPISYYSLSKSNDSATSSDLKGAENIHIECNASSYGFDLDMNDCESAKAFIPADSEETVWAERHMSSLERYQPLPYRSMGSKAVCYVEPSLINGATSGRASANQIRNAASMIRDQCYSGGKLQGGIATNIGGDARLAVVMGSYKAPSEIQCRGDVGAAVCEVVLEEMSANTTVQTFGPRADVSVAVPLPYVVWPDDARCQLGISNTLSASASDKASWYEVWEATVAIWSVCLRKQKGGMLTLGDDGNLFLAMTATGAAPPVTSDTTIQRVEQSNSRSKTKSDTTTSNPIKAPMALQRGYALVPPSGSLRDPLLRQHS